MNADWNKIINKPNIITDSSSFATLSILNSQLSILSDTYLTKTSVISSDSVVGLTANLTNLTNNKADSIHQHLISNITDSIPFSRITGAPASIDTTIIENRITNLESDSIAKANRAQNTENRVQSLESDSSFKTLQLSNINSQLSTLSDSHIKNYQSDTKTGDLTVGDTVFAQFFVGNGKMLTGVLKLTDVISADSISGGTITGNVTINTNKPITTTDTITATNFVGDGSGLNNISSLKLFEQIINLPSRTWNLNSYTSTEELISQNINLGTYPIIILKIELSGQFNIDANGYDASLLPSFNPYAVAHIEIDSMTLIHQNNSYANVSSLIIEKGDLGGGSNRKGIYSYNSASNNPTSEIKSFSYPMFSSIILSNSIFYLRYAYSITGGIGHNVNMSINDVKVKLTYIKTNY